MANLSSVCCFLLVAVAMLAAGSQAETNKKVQAIAEAASAALKGAVAAGQLTQAEAQAVDDKIKEAAKKNALIPITEASVALNAAMEAKVIEFNDKAKMLVNAVKVGLDKKTFKDLTETVAAVVDAAVAAKILTPATAAKVKEVTPKTINI